MAVAAAVVDHIKPHRLKAAINGGKQDEIAKAQKLFWDKTNWQPLCKQHHDSTKQREEKRGHVIGCDENGLPLDLQSHWYKSIKPCVRTKSLHTIINFQYVMNSF